MTANKILDVVRNVLVTNAVRLDAFAVLRCIESDDYSAEDLRVVLTPCLD